MLDSSSVVQNEVHDAPQSAAFFPGINAGLLSLTLVAGY
jgi:hypothetical protein